MKKEISILQYFKKMLNKIWLVAILTVIGAGLMFTYSEFFIEPQYTSSAKMIVSNKTSGSTGSNNTISNSDIVASSSLVKTYKQVIKTTNLMQLVCDRIEEYKKNPDPKYDFLDDANHSAAWLAEKVKVEAVDDTEVFVIKIDMTDPKEAHFIVESITILLPEFASERVKNSSVKLLEDATEPNIDNPSSPNVMRNTIIGAAVGFLISAVIVFILLLTDTVVYTEEDLTEKFDGITILGTIPLMHSEGDNKASADSKTVSKK